MLAWLWHGNSSAGTTGPDANRVPSEKSRNTYDVTPCSPVDRARHSDHCKKRNCDGIGSAALQLAVLHVALYWTRSDVLCWTVSAIPRYMWSRHCAASVSGPVVTQTAAACPGGNGFDFRAASPCTFRVFATVPAEIYGNVLKVCHDHFLRKPSCHSAVHKPHSWWIVVK
jgi:hypothetical protein